MLAQQSVHLVCTTPSSTGESTDTMDLGTTSGRIVTTDGDLSITTILVDGIAYNRTNIAGAWADEGIPQAEAEKLVAAGDWLSIGPGQSYGHLYLNYATAIAGMTVADHADPLRLTGPLTRTGATWAQAVSVYGVSGGAPSDGGPPGTTESVYIAASGTPLPVSVTAHSSSYGTDTCNFSDWDEPLHLTAPANVVPITSIPK